ncbi:hypothetical protein BH11MYX4_BH11MYX4_46260 [soil metagenome]
MRTRTIVSVASLVGLSLGGTALGAPSGGGGGTTIPGSDPGLPHPIVHYGTGVDPRADTSWTCSTAPTLALCNNAQYALCPIAQQGCTAVAQAASATYASGSTATCLMDATGDHCVPTSVKKYPTLYKKNDGTSWQAQEAAAMRNARIARETASRGFDAATYTRNPKYLSRTSRVDSCEAYVYSKYYDYERFLDSSYACGTNDQCVFDVAFKDYANPAAGAPRVAKRPLLDREGAPLTSRSWAEVAGAALELNSSDLLPKNPFYASAAFMPPAVFDALFAAWAGDAAMVAKLQALQTQLAKGYNFYTYGGFGQPAVETYSTVWDWHLAMSNRLKPKAYPHAQQMEFLRRNDVINTSVWALASTLACSNMSLDCTVIPFQIARVSPGMAESYPSDPFAVSSLMTKNDRFSAALQGVFASSFSPSTMPEAFLNMNIGQLGVPGFHTAGAKSVPGAPLPAGTAVSTGPRSGSAPVFAPAPSWTGFPADYWTAVNYSNQNQLQAASRVLQNRWAPAAPASVDPARGPGAHPRMNCDAPGVQNDGVLMAACETANIVLDEWSRTLAGNESCLDMSGYACDWSPIEFRESLLGAQRLQYSREIDYQECLQYTHNSFAPDAAGYGTVTYAQEATWKTVQTRIAAIITALSEFNKKVPQIARPRGGDPFPKALGTVYGDRAKDKQEWGNDTFGAGYWYDIGWDAAVLDRKRDANNNPTGVITKMQLDFDGEFEAHANAFGKSISLLDAQLGARINDGNLGTVDAEHYLYVIGFGSFDGLENKGFSKVADINSSFQLANPSDKFEKNVFDAGFWVGPVYVHVGVDVEFFYGAPLEGNVKMPLDNGPLAPVDGKLISGMLTFHPKAGVNADLYAYGGWGPIAEVGVEAQLNLITVGLPMTSEIAVVARQPQPNHDVLYLTVKEGIDVSIETLSGEIDLCGKIFGIGGCTSVVSWKGLHQQFPLFTAVDEEVELDVLQ